MYLLRTIIFIVVCIFCGSCKLTEKDAIGLYRWDRVQKTLFKLNSDKTFEFERNNPNPYLHPFDHPDENYFVNHGTWRMDNNKIILTSNTDSLSYPLFQVNKSNALDTAHSHFTFFDSYQDVVKILYVKLNDTSMISALHRSMDAFKFDLQDVKEIEFHFYGYRPLKLTPDQSKNFNYAINLSPEYRPRIFKDTEFTLKRRKIIDKRMKAVFRKVE